MGSKKKPMKKRTTARSKKITERFLPVTSTEKAWVEVGTLHKTADFKVTKNISPADTLSERMKALTTWYNEKGASITDYGITPKTAEHFKNRLTKHAEKKFPFLVPAKIASAVGMTLLNVEPATVTHPEAKDFVLYVQLDALNAGRVKINTKD